MNVIYAYKKKSQNKIVYVGQSVALETRHKQHILYDPYNSKNKEYDYPLSRGIRKYGPEEYELLVLEENVPLDLLDDREKFWIAYYDTYWHGYNQTVGGTYPTKPIFHDDIIGLTIEMLKNEEYSYKDIMDKTGMSMTHIYNINIGARRPQANQEYPIRKQNTKGTKGLKFSEVEIKAIHEDLKNTIYTFKDLAKKYDCSATTIRYINQGVRKAYRLSEYSYPIRGNAKSVAKQAYWNNLNE